ncbi:hypothetical protein RB195_023781 [Necator americanus]|uniref:Uncharacterized protein n=1 Tax=Necator americanus TaxID=51031 RepID=A0ABR1EKP9_NECAM
MTIVKDRPLTVIAQSREEMCRNIKEYLVETIAHLVKYNGLISIGVSDNLIKAIRRWLTVKRVPSDSTRMPPRHYVSGGYAREDANMPRQNHALVVHGGADKPSQMLFWP